MLKKYLLTKFKSNGYADTEVGDKGDVIEYGVDAEDARKRAAQKHGAGHYMVIGEFS